MIQISGRGANVNNQEGDAALCPITRWTLGSVPADSDVPVAPDFSLSAPQRLLIAARAVAFYAGKVVRQALNVVGSCKRIDDVSDARLMLKYQLSIAGDPRREFSW